MWDLLTLLLILSPVSPTVPHHASPPMWQSLKRVALLLEVVGPEERWIDDYQSELNYVRRHLRELTSAPALDDCLIFPSSLASREGRCFNLAYQRSLELRRNLFLHHQEELDEALQEAKHLARIWALVDAAGCQSQSWVCRRKALLHLRELLGPEAYYSGTIPPCAPLWRFELISPSFQIVGAETEKK
ncbi:MAG TPA: hypothetical protein VK395_15475 [Gemmataceae bacterium]|nr:hypothetical protein [Gemmataceae bacterium]